MTAKSRSRFTLRATILMSDRRTHRKRTRDQEERAAIEEDLDLAVDDEPLLDFSDEIDELE